MDYDKSPDGSKTGIDPETLLIYSLADVFKSYDSGKYYGTLHTL